MKTDISQPLILNAWLKHANRLIFTDDFGDDFDLVKDGDIERIIQILGNPTTRNWCNKQRSPKFETCSLILDEAFELAIEELSEKYGPAWENWNWGAAHKSIHEHRPFTHVDSLTDMFTVSPEIAGGKYTLLRSKHKFSNENPYAAVTGAAYRAFYDFSNLNNSGYMISTGQSGNVMSKHYDDLAPKWSAVDYLKMSTQAQDYRREDNATLIFTPASN